MQKQLDHSDTSIVFTVEEDLGLPELVSLLSSLFMTTNRKWYSAGKVTKAASGRPLIVFSPTNTYHANSISYNQIIRTVPTKDLLLRLSQVRRASPHVGSIIDVDVVRWSLIQPTMLPFYPTLLAPLVRSIDETPLTRT